MLERESDLSVYIDALPTNYDTFRYHSSRWFDNLPDMPYPGMARSNACECYGHMLDEFAKNETEQYAMTQQDIQQIFDADKQRLTPYIKTRPDNDFTLKNVLAIGVWYEREEFEKEEGRTTQYQMIKQVNALILQVIDPTTPAQLPPLER